MSNIASHWWMFVVRGLTSLALAVFLLVGPGWSSGAALAVALGIYAIIDGASSLGFVAGTRGIHRGTYVVRGVLGIAAGVLALSQPFASRLTLFLLAGTWGMVTGA